MGRINYHTEISNGVMSNFIFNPTLLQRMMKRRLVLYIKKYLISILWTFDLLNGMAKKIEICSLYKIQITVKLLKIAAAIIFAEHFLSVD